VLFCCDKITQDDAVVLLEERLDYLRKRDGTVSEKKIASFNRKLPIAKKFEDELFSAAGITSKDVKIRFSS
jgi:hypothetical protein